MRVMPGGLVSARGGGPRTAGAGRGVAKACALRTWRPRQSDDRTYPLASSSAFSRFVCGFQFPAPFRALALPFRSSWLLDLPLLLSALSCYLLSFAFSYASSGVTSFSLAEAPSPTG